MARDLYNVTVKASTNAEPVSFNTTAETLGELKAELQNRGIITTGMAFFEGVSRTEMTRDDAVLPSNIPYRGQVRNDLVFLMTPDTKHIKSGAMTRQEIYDVFAQNPELKHKVYVELGLPYTNMTTKWLNDFLNSQVVKPCSEGYEAVVEAYVALGEALKEAGFDVECTCAHKVSSAYSADEIEEMLS